MRRRVRQLVVADSFLLMMTRGFYQVVENALPADAKVLHLEADNEKLVIRVFIESAQFPEVDFMNWRDVPELSGAWICQVMKPFSMKHNLLCFMN